VICSWYDHSCLYLVSLGPCLWMILCINMYIYAYVYRILYTYINIQLSWCIEWEFQFMKIHEANFRLDNVPVCSSTLILTFVLLLELIVVDQNPWLIAFGGQPHYDPHNHGRVVPPYNLIYIYNKIIILIYIYISILRLIFINKYIYINEN
jgi:hypothetical protein